MKNMIKKTLLVGLLLIASGQSVPFAKVKKTLNDTAQSIKRDYQRLLGRKPVRISIETELRFLDKIDKYCQTLLNGLELILTNLATSNLSNTLNPMKQAARALKISLTQLFQSINASNSFAEDVTITLNTRVNNTVNTLSEINDTLAKIATKIDSNFSNIEKDTGKSEYLKKLFTDVINPIGSALQSVFIKQELNMPEYTYRFNIIHGPIPTNQSVSIVIDNLYTLKQNIKDQIKQSNEVENRLDNKQSYISQAAKKNLGLVLEKIGMLAQAYHGTITPYENGLLNKYTENASRAKDATLRFLSRQKAKFKSLFNYK